MWFAFIHWSPYHLKMYTLHRVMIVINSNLNTIVLILYAFVPLLLKFEINLDLTSKTVRTYIRLMWTLELEQFSTFFSDVSWWHSAWSRRLQTWAYEMNINSSSPGKVTDEPHITTLETKPKVHIISLFMTTLL